MGCANSKQTNTIKVMSISNERKGMKSTLDSALHRARGSIVSVESPLKSKTGGRGSWSPMICSPDGRKRSSSTGPPLREHRAARHRPKSFPAVHGDLRGTSPEILVDGQSTQHFPVSGESNRDEGYATPQGSPRLSRLTLPEKGRPPPIAEDEGLEDEPSFESAAQLGLSETALRMAAAFEAALDADDDNIPSEGSELSYTLGAEEDPYALPDDNLQLPPLPGPPALPERRYKNCNRTLSQDEVIFEQRNTSTPPSTHSNDDVAQWLASVKCELSLINDQEASVSMENENPGRMVSDMSDVSIVSNISTLSSVSNHRKVMSMPPADAGDTTIYTKICKKNRALRDDRRMSSA